MKAICINTQRPGTHHHFIDITLGRVYDVIRETKNDWVIINNDNKQCLYLKKNLMALDEWRQQQIDKIISNEQ